MAPKGAPPAAKAAAPPAKDDKKGGKEASAPPDAPAGKLHSAAAPKNKEEVLAQVNLDGLPHCPNEQIIEIIKERYDTLVSVFIHYCKQSECKTLEQATRLRLGTHRCRCTLRLALRLLLLVPAAALQLCPLQPLSAATFEALMLRQRHDQRASGPATYRRADKWPQ